MLPTSGQISLGDIRTALNQTGQISLNDSSCRSLAGKPSGQIAFTDFYSTGAWSSSVALPRHIGGHAQSTLLDGRVMVTGGWDDQNSASNLYTAYVFNLSTGLWSQVANAPYNPVKHVQVTLQDGRVFVFGGSGLTYGYLYNPSNNTWVATTSAPDGLARTSAGASLLPDGRVLITGGSSGGGVIATTVIYNPANNTWSMGPTLPSIRCYHTQCILPNGYVLVAGGANGTQTILSSTLILNTTTMQWSNGPTLPVPVFSHAMSIMSTGAILITGGGPSYGVRTTTTQLYNPNTNTWSTSVPLPLVLDWHGQSLNADGSILLTGGVTTSGITRSECYRM